MEKQELINFVESAGGHVSFAELNREFGDVIKGEHTIMYGNPDNNVIIWPGVSNEFSDLIRSLVNEGVLGAKQVDIAVYLIDGEILDMPVAKRPNRAYKDLRWLPTVLNIQNNDEH